METELGLKVKFRLVFLWVNEYFAKKYYFKLTWPEIGIAATVKLDPPDVSSRWLMSTNGVSPFAREAVQDTTYSRIGIPASIKARVAAFTQAQ